MTQHDEGIRLRHMYDYAREAVELASGRRRQDLDTDRMLNLALVRLAEVVGEAATRISKETKEKMVDIPWPQVVGLRNRLIHAYDEVDFDILWKITQEDLPTLVASLRKVLEDQL